MLPVLLFSTADSALAASIREVFAPNWRVETAENYTSGRADLMVIDGKYLPLAQDARASGRALERTPIVLVADSESQPDPVVDEVVAAPPTHGVLTALASRWTPLVTPALDRLSAAFGAEEVARLAAGLCAQLDAAIPPLARGEAVDGAHRIAGMAGMLGFADLGRYWAALDDGHDVDRRALRIATRKAIVALDRFAPA